MSLSKRLEQARNAFSQKDMQASAQAHDPKRIAQAAAEQHGGLSSQYLGDMVYGGLDGIITTFAVVSGVAGADLGAHIVIILGLANLLADGFSNLPLTLCNGSVWPGRGQGARDTAQRLAERDGDAPGGRAGGRCGLRHRRLVERDWRINERRKLANVYQS